MIDTAKGDMIGAMMVAIMGGVIGIIMHPSLPACKIGIGGGVRLPPQRKFTRPKLPLR